MAATNLRIGLEQEFFGLSLTYRESRTNEFWKIPDGVQAETTMTQQRPILVPADPSIGPYYAPASDPPRVLWESNWGFRAVGDSYGMAAVLGQDVGSCQLELNTAANLVSDHVYWVTARLCAKAFADTIDDCTALAAHALPADGSFADGARRWYPLQSFLDRYNSRIDALNDGYAARDSIRQRFKLQKSSEILKLEAGTHPEKRYRGFWNAYVAASTNAADRWCDVQVNYQLSLRTLGENIDAWIGTWDSMWVPKFGDVVLDPDIGSSQQVAERDIIRVQMMAAIWRAARGYAEDLTSKLPAAGAGNERSLVIALVTYVLASGAVTFVEMGGSLKNSYPQLPKTSPASIAHLLATMNPALVPFFNTLARDVVKSARKAVVSLRSPKDLASPPGNLPKKSIVPGGRLLPSLRPQDVAMLSGDPEPANFAPFWNGAFDLSLPLTEANNFGYTSEPDFFVIWAKEVNTSIPALTFGAGNREVRILLESRYGRNKLNMGFDPYIRDFMFNRSYLALVGLLEPGVYGAVKAIVDAKVPDDRYFEQHFPDGSVH